jgi:hypothetical protein
MITQTQRRKKMSKNILRIALILMFCPIAFGQTVEYHGVCVGDNYPGTGYELHWCVADAQGIKQTLLANQSWIDGNITLKLDADATKQHIIDAVSAMPKNSSNIDLFHDSSHGSTSGLFTYDGLYISPSDLQGVFGSFNQYTAWLDACQTGVFTTNMTTGIILAACRADEYASEYAALGHGTFSYYLIQGLTNNTAAGGNGLLTAQGLYNYAAPLTTAYDGSMHPQLKDNYGSNLNLNLNIYVPQQYSTVSPALSASHSGQTVVLSSGSQTVSSSLTVPSGVTLSIKPAVTMSFGSGVSLTSNGILNVAGTSSQPITFTRSGTSGSWGSIVISGSGANGSTLSYVNMQHGTKILVNNAASVTIQNCSLTNNNGAMDFEGSSGLVQNNYISYSADYHGIIVAGGSNVNCYHNALTKTDHSYYPYYHDVGIYYSGGAGGNIGQNDLDYFSWGIGINYSSSPHFHSPNSNQNNRVTNCYYGINIYNNSYPVIGYNAADCWGANSIHDNNYSNDGYDIQLYGETFQLDALGTYWNGGNPNNAHLYAGSGCGIDKGMALSTDPWAGFPIPSMQKGPVAPILASPKGGQPMASMSSVNSERAASVSDSFADPLSNGFLLRNQGKFKEAKDFFVSYLAKYPNEQRAYVELYNCADGTTLPDLIQYFNSLPNQADKEQNLLLSYLYLKQGDAKSARQVNNSIISANPNTSIGSQAKLNNFYISLYNDNDAQAALSVLNDVLDKKDWSDSMAISTADQALHTYVDPKTGTMPYVSYQPSANGSQQSAVGTQQAQTGLMENYPNPFNPTTRINYQLKVTGHVTLKVYDILGREVTTLVDESQESGIHYTTFDGTRLASGVYFYRLTAPGVNQMRKMMLTK